MFSGFAVFVVAALSALTAAPSAASGTFLEANALPPAQIASFRPYTLFAAAVGCDPNKTKTWTCGAACDSLPGFVLADYDGNDFDPFWFVGFYPPLNSVIIAHRGTDISKPQVFTIGAALSLLDAVSLRSRLPSTTVKFVGIGTPRVGNPTFADYIDATVTLGNFTRINNKQDPVPLLPSRFLGFMHPSGEIHISADDQWLACPGQDSNATGCINDTESLFVNSSVIDHIGPYDGIVFDGSQCN
ncbi:alpha/beta-hydrolase [Auricularia subglabra TFB-10046 SS5]|nr:alpha/beta-hydrolase [Auricularia subglabra TFB-10046 SS5]